MKNKRNNLRRKDNYIKLRAVGFTSKEANKYKDLSRDKINRLIYIKTHYNSDLNKHINDILGGATNESNES